MLAKLSSATILGIESLVISVEVDISYGLPSFHIVGLADTAILESRDRVKSAIKNSNQTFPSRRITVNLAPTHLKKVGAQFDLAIALGILAANNVVPRPQTNQVFYGALSLDGRVQHVQGVLAVALDLAAESSEQTELYVSPDSSYEALLVNCKNLTIFLVPTLRDLILHLTGKKRLMPLGRPMVSAQPTKRSKLEIYNSIVGQYQAKRVLAIAAAGNHNILFIGPPGAGKTLLAHALYELLPPLSHYESLESTRIYSVAGLLSSQQPIVSDRPFRSPHHTASKIAIIGGGRLPKPGELTLAHNGVLFLDELLEFDRDVLSVLRQPLESGSIHITKSLTSVTYPASILLVAATNPCPCGYWGDATRKCACSPHTIRRYQAKLSGPLLDRIDLSVYVPAVDADEITTRAVVPPPLSRIAEARKWQERRYKGTPYSSNAQVEVSKYNNYLKVDAQCQAFLRQLVRERNLSVRSCHKIVAVSRTIADLETSEEIKIQHIAEACQYRYSLSGS